jgi:hypothetical protein
VGAHELCPCGGNPAKPICANKFRSKKHSFDWLPKD